MAADKILEKIRKLVKFANNGSASEAEVESYMRMAKKLMEEHNVAEHQVLADEKNVDAHQAAYDAMREEWSGYEQSTQVLLFDRHLLIVVCEICGVEAYFKHTYESLREPGKCKDFLAKDRFESVWFAGLPVDIAVAKEFFKELQASVRTLARVHFGPKWNRKHYEYSCGFAFRLVERARSFRQDMAPKGNCVAIVLAKGAILSRWMKVKFPTMGEPKKTKFKAKQYDAYLHGRRDAEGFDLGVDDRLTAAKGGGK